MLFTIENPTPFVASEQLNKPNIEKSFNQTLKMAKSPLSDNTLQVNMAVPKEDIDTALLQKSADFENKEVIPMRTILDAPPEIKALYVKEVDISKLGIYHINGLNIQGTL